MFGTAAKAHGFPWRLISAGQLADVLEERRKRLSSVSWFMRCMSEVIAQMANAEEECAGRRRTRRMLVCNMVRERAGCLPMILAEYLQLLDWTGRRLHPGKRGAISENAPDILERPGTSAEVWLHRVRRFGKRRKFASVSAARCVVMTSAGESPRLSPA